MAKWHVIPCGCIVVGSNPISISKSFVMKNLKLNIKAISIFILVTLVIIPYYILKLFK